MSSQRHVKGSEQATGWSLIVWTQNSLSIVADSMAAMHQPLTASESRTPGAAGVNENGVAAMFDTDCAS